MLTAPKPRFTNRRSAAATIASRDPLRRAFAMIDLHQCRVGGGASLWSIRMRQCECASRYSDGGVCDYGSRMSASATYRLQWR